MQTECLSIKTVSLTLSLAVITVFNTPNTLNVTNSLMVWTWYLLQVLLGMINHTRNGSNIWIFMPKLMIFVWKFKTLAPINSWLMLWRTETPHCLKITQNVAFEFWHFPPIFVLLKVTCLVTLFDRKLQVCKNLLNWPFLAFLINFCPLKM